MTNKFPYADDVVDCIDNGVFVIDKSFKIHLWNDFMSIHSRFSAEQIIGLNLFECFPELPKKWFERKVKSIYLLKNQSYTSWEQRPYIFKFSHGRSVTGGVEHMYQNCCFTPIFDLDNNVECVCVTIKNVTDLAIKAKQLKDAVTQLEYISSIDGLTQIFNRTHWEQRFKTEVERVKRYKNKVSLIMFDMDNFKKINDKYGHLGGDEVLRKTAERCVNLFRSVDVIGRYGGEEFCVFLPETNIENTRNVAEKLRHAIADTPVHYESKEIFISASIGFTCSNKEKNNYEALLKEADEALYTAKKNGRNQCVNFLDIAPED